MSTVYLQPNSPISDLTKLEFMYTPQIEYSHDVKYDAYSLTHTNYQPYAFTRSENPSISLSCKFSAHTTEHFARSEYAIRFLRTYTKMNYGRKDGERGQPPRVLRFYAYGSHLFENVPVVISKFSMTLPEDIDYVTAQGGELKMVSPEARQIKTATNDPTITRLDPVVVTGQRITEQLYLPVVFTINISLLVQQNLSKTVNTFTLQDFADGELSGEGYI